MPCRRRRGRLLRYVPRSPAHPPGYGKQRHSLANFTIIGQPRVVGFGPTVGVTIIAQKKKQALA
jgi:hypothetical protein